MFLE
jgi:hypothetical protein